MLKRKSFKKGAASFYIVAFSTLILLIVATSFAAIIIAEVTRTSNDDLSQSAYDSALAGVEDAKLAFYNYQSCIAQGATATEPKDDSLSCGNIIYYMENDNCDMVAHALGRINFKEEGEVVIKESSSNNNMMQAYTCDKVKLSLKDIRFTLSSSNQIKVVQPKFDSEDGVNAQKIKYVKVSWFEEKDGDNYKYANFDSASGAVAFKPSNLGTATPPTISIAMIQTDQTFTLADFDKITGNYATDRGMIYLVPFGEAEKEAATKQNSSFKVGYNATRKENYIEKAGFVESNDRLGGDNRNVPYTVYCPEIGSGEDKYQYACSVLIELPEPVGASGSAVRNDDTFFFITSIPYGEPSTSVSLEFFCADGVECAPKPESSPDGEEEDRTSQANLKGVQVEIDSTGRANNLYRRVVARIDTDTDDYPLSIMGPLELLGDNNDEGLKKNFFVTSEWDFKP